MPKVYKEIHIKKFIFIFFFIVLTLQANSAYSKFISEQIAFVSQMEDANLTQDAMEDILEKQERSYVETLENIMSNKQNFLSANSLYTPEIATLKKMIQINEHAGNKYAVIRDEVQLKSYALLRIQNFMIKDVLIALDSSNMKTFEKELNKIVAKNQLDNKEFTSVDYKPYLEIGSDGTLAEVKQNIKDFYAIIDINKDVINHLYTFEKRMYRLNKYSKYHLISIVIYINNTAIGKNVNPILESYGLSITKIISILFLSLLLYALRRYIFVVAQKYFAKVDAFEKYLARAIEKIKKPLSTIIVLINIELAFYIYNDFISLENLSKIFNIFYSFLLVWLLYRVLNVVVNMKIEEIDQSNKKIKNEIINVGKKVINFIIIIIGLLLILYFAGVNLTAVLSGLGLGGFALALASKDSLSNFFGTLSILLSDVYSQGDWIVVDGEEGVVIEIGLRVTTIRTFDNALIAIPNASLANKDVKNWSKRTLGRRIKISIGVKYSSKSEDIKNAIHEIREMLDKHTGIATKNTKYEYTSTNRSKLVSKEDLQGIKKELFVYLDEFSTSSINILVYCFSKSVVWEDWLRTKEDVMHKIMEILEKNSLEFAFPSMSIYNETQQSSK